MWDPVILIRIILSGSFNVEYAPSQSTEATGALIKSDGKLGCSVKVPHGPLWILKSACPVATNFPYCFIILPNQRLLYFLFTLYLSWEWTRRMLSLQTFLWTCFLFTSVVRAKHAERDVHNSSPLPQTSVPLPLLNIILIQSQYNMKYARRHIV